MSAALADFGAEVEKWLQDNAPKSLVGTAKGLFDGAWGGKKETYEDNPDVKRWLDMCAERGWTAPTWPKAYGGGGLSKAQAAILQRAMRKMKLPPPLVGFGLVMIGPTLLEFGTEAQKREHLPKIVRGEIRWCQGYSEPNAGSDLASLATRAERDGDHFVVNGQKVWTSYADKADWIFCLVRTSSEGRKQNGITFLLIDMESPGVTTRPILLISGASPFCETFFTDVRVPVSNVIGEIDRGWTVAKALLNHERTILGASFAESLSNESDSVVAHAKRRLGVDDEGRIADPLLRDEIARSDMDEACFMATVQRLKDAAKAGQPPGPESSILKVYGTELRQRRRDLSVRILGPQGLGWEGPGFDPVELKITREWLRSRGNSIEGGTSEIQLNIIAKRVLGLPDAGKGV